MILKKKRNAEFISQLLTVERMPESAPDSEVIGLISDGSGRPVTIMENEDGSYTDEEGNEYYESEDGTFYDDYDATYEVSGTND